MQRIPLSQGKFALIDDEDYEYLSKYKWCAICNHKHWYAVRTDVSTNTRRTVFMHRVIMKTPPELVVDHKDRDGLNNQKSNLCNCTVQQNSLNNVSRYGESKYKGVYWNVKRNKWHTRITVNRCRIHVGYFESEDDAAIAYNKAIEKYNSINTNSNIIERS